MSLCGVCLIVGARAAFFATTLVCREDFDVESMQMITILQVKERFGVSKAFLSSYTADV
jgi:hypothetical protein